MRDLRPKTLRGQLRGLVVLGVLSALLVEAAGMVAERRDAIRRASDEAARLSQMAAAYDHQAVDGARQMLLGLARTHEVTSRDGIESSRLFRALLRERSAYASVSAAAPDGRVFASSHALESPVDVARAPWFERALRADDLVVSDYQIGAVTGLPTFKCALAARDSHGVARAVLFADMDLESFSRLAAELGLPDGASLVVLDRFGVVVSRWPEPGGWMGRRYVSPRTVAAMRAGAADLRDVRGSDGVRRVMGFTLIGDREHGSLLVGVGFRRERVLAAATREMTWSLLGLVLMGLAAWMLASRGLERLVLRPVESLVHATRRVGRGHFDVRFAPGALPGELAELARAFDAMTSRLRRHRQRQQRWAEAVRLSERRKAAVLEAALDAILTFDDEGRVLEFNPAAERMFGMKAREVLGRPVAELVLPPGVVQLRGTRRAHGALRVPPGRAVETTAVRADQREFPVEVAVAEAGVQDGRLLFTAFVRDISDRVRHEEALRSMSLLDPLTGLYNRRGFLTFAGQQLRLAERTGATVTLLFADLDGLKQINDTHGHAAGDQAIRDGATLLRETFRDSDVIGRMGGDEFVVLTLDPAGTPIPRLLARLDAAVRARNATHTERPAIGFSAGAVQRAPGERATFSEMLLRGDQLMYEQKRAKKAGAVRVA